jgi:hypothetical protein
MPTDKAADKAAKTICVVLTRNPKTLERFPPQTRVTIGMSDLDLPDLDTQHAGFDLDVATARQLVQVCPQYKFKTDTSEE